jgi:hypothetical protein
VVIFIHYLDAQEDANTRYTTAEASRPSACPKRDIHRASSPAGTRLLSARSPSPVICHGLRTTASISYEATNDNACEDAGSSEPPLGNNLDEVAFYGPRRKQKRS